MNYLWGIMMLVGVVYAAFSGNLSAVTEQAVDSAKEAVNLCITMAGVMAFWVGLMQIAESAGMIRQAQKRLDPVITFLFPGLGKDHPARKPIAANIISNILGLGWAATPAGLLAMKELYAAQEAKGRAARKKAMAPAEKSDRVPTDAMCDFLILNISSLQLIPINIIAYRSQYGSASPTAIVGPAILATAMSTIAAVIFIKLRQALGRNL